ncbi:MAG: winged helix DNA-binding domain-containing protein [Pseudonocardia sp.]|nr:winged helix DNA-binding domain-containing protein [Pseudonocardia sp.]
MTGAELGRSAALAYRASIHDLEQPVATPLDCGVLDVGVQDTPPGTTAGPAIRARVRSPGDLALSPGLALVHSLRGAMHVHRARDLPLLVAALRPEDADDGGAVDQVAEAMIEVLSDDAPRTKGELSTEITGILPPPIRPWCQVCRVDHVDDGLFRMATLPAGLQLRPVGHRSAGFFRVTLPSVAEPAPARRELLRRFLRRCGPTCPKDLAAWIGITPAIARRWWELLADELVEVRVDGKRLWMHTEDLAVARAAAAPTAVWLLPPYDPLVEVTNRELLLTDKERRQQLWRAVANPGAVLLAGDVIGTWRRRRKVITVCAFKPFSTAQQRMVQAAAVHAASDEIEVRFSG